jgi:hypothetical protein
MSFTQKSNALLIFNMYIPRFYCPETLFFSMSRSVLGGNESKHKCGRGGINGMKEQGGIGLARLQREGKEAERGKKELC